MRKQSLKASQLDARKLEEELRNGQQQQKEAANEAQKMQKELQEATVWTVGPKREKRLV